MSTRRPLLRWVATLVVVTSILVVLRPWTIRPIESAQPKVFDPATFVTSVWARAIAEADRTAVDVAATAEPADGLKARFVKGQGLVTAVDRQSRVGVLRVSVAGAGGGTRLVTLQVGPVIRGTAVRDALSFVQFSDFTNQFEFAAAANALNDHVLASVPLPVAIDAVKGRSVVFVGATPRSGAEADAVLDVVPVRLTVVNGGAR